MISPLHFSIQCGALALRRLSPVSLLLFLVVAGCASVPSVSELNALTDSIVKASFRSQGVANVERVTQTDETNRLCSEADVAGTVLGPGDGFGEILGGHIRRKGAVGLVCDGAIRDVGTLAGWTDFSVFTRSVTPRGERDRCNS